MINFSSLSVVKITHEKEKISGKIFSDRERTGTLALFFGYSPNSLEKIDSIKITISNEPLDFEFFASIPLYYKNQINYYQLKFYEEENELGASQVIYFEKLTDPIPLTINEKLERAFTVKEGVDVFLFRRVRSGPKCPDCFDEVKNEPTISFCEKCYGTGYLNGYYPKIKIFGQFLLMREVEYLTPFGRIKPNDASFVTLYEPKLYTNDLLLDVNYKRFYEVLAVRTPIIKRLLCYQIAQIRELEPQAVCFRLLNKIKEE